MPHNTQTMRERKLAMKQWFFSQAFRSVLLCSIIVLGILNVVQVTTASTSGYELTDLQREIQTLTHEYDRLQVKIAEKRSMVFVQEQIESYGFTEALAVDFLTVPASQVALR
jgi:hypothetical protein